MENLLIERMDYFIKKRDGEKIGSTEWFAYYSIIEELLFLIKQIEKCKK